MFLLHALNHHAHVHSRRYAAEEVKLDANMDELPEIEGGLKELEEASHIGGRSGPYWTKIRSKILSCSSTQDVDEALKEWDRSGSAWVSPGGTCELCGHNPISFHFPIKNRVTGTSLVVGSECIYNYLSIPGFGSMEELRRRLNGERARLKKKEMGLISEEALARFQEASELEAQLRARIEHLAAGEQDFDFREYRNTLWDISGVVRNLPGATKVTTDLLLVQSGLDGISRIHSQLSDRSKKLRSTGLLAMVSATMRLQNDVDKLGFLKRMQGALNDMLRVGYPAEFVKRCWEAIRDEKSSILAKIDESVSKQRDILKLYDPVLDKLKPYDHLHFTLAAGIAASIKMLEKEADEAKALVMQEDFIEVITKAHNQISTLIGFASTNPLNRFQSSLVTAALAVDTLVKRIEYGAYSTLGMAISEKYRLKTYVPRDEAGVRISCYRAFDDGILEPTEKNPGPALVALLRQDNAKLIEIVQQEVDDVKALRKEDFWEFLSKRWDFDVQKAFKVFSKDGGFEQGFCESLVKNWERWPKLSPKQMGVIQKKMSQRDREVEKSMWEALKPALTRPAPN